MSLSLVISQIILLIFSIVCVILYPKWKQYLHPETINSSENNIFDENIGGYIFTKEELSAYGPNSHDAIYMGLLGRVYDVTVGRKHYGIGGVYSHFAGIDGTRAFSTGKFDKDGLVEDVRGLTIPQILDVLTWYDFYGQRYPLVGRVAGLFYNSEGQKTDVALETEKLFSEAYAYKEMEKEIRNKYPPCNVHTNNEGSTFWCSEKSGGIEREWVGVPRQFFNSLTHETNCVCVEDSSTLNSDMRLYSDCVPDSHQCFIKS